MSSVQVVAPVMCGRISPAAVWIEKRSESVQPARRRYMTASRAPLPDSSASEPSGLKIRSRATNPALGRLAQQEDPVRADAGVRIADALDAAGRELERQGPLLEDEVVVAERLPLLETDRGHAGAESMVAATSSGVRPPMSTSSTPGSLRIHVSWRRA